MSLTANREHDRASSALLPREDCAVEVHALSCSFRGKPALIDASLRVPTGTVYGLVGPNGAGKTTLIRHLIGAMRAVQGTVRVLGQDPTIEPENVLAKIGYMTEEDSLPSWMRVSDLLSFCRTVYPTWSGKLAKEMCEMFSLSPSQRLRSMSKGGRARVALLAATAHRPDLLILDEPNSGLDPVARADILEAIIRTTAEEGRTVLFSSHLLEEIDRVCDSVTLIHEGRVKETVHMDTLSDTYEECIYRSDQPDGHAPELFVGAFGPIRDGNEWSVIGTSALIDAGGKESLASRDANWRLVERRSMTLSRWFDAHVRAQPMVDAGDSDHE